ncbi:MAG TPA: TIGR03032 family protein [Thermoanaerobaculia bacterium]|nr:TIGR03032 family protein [Thermoanaerobaculia bacterium]
MRLDRELIRLPFTFDAARLAEEIAQFDESDWRPHPQGYPGNSALPLIAVHGNPDDDDVKGPMHATPHLDRCPYLRQVLAAFHAVWGRTRLMRLDGNAEATAHCDTNYYWAQHARVHVPIVTSDDVEFFCGDAKVHMAAGEAWIFDTWRVHNVINPRPTRRIHLVADTIGSAAFWELVERGRNAAPAQPVAYDPLRLVAVTTEAVNHPIVMAPAEQVAMMSLVLDAGGTDTPVCAVLDSLREDWRAAYARFGENRDGFPLYRSLLDRAAAALDPLRGKVRLRNHIDAVDAVHSLVLRPALDDAAPRPRPQQRARRIERPIFLVCSPRSGSSMFFETLAQSPTVWTVGGESHQVIESIPALHPAQRRFHSNRLDASDATPEIITQLERNFVRELRNRDRRTPRAGATGLRLLEKTPKNSLRVPFLAEAFPDALFVYLYRDMRDTISSMLDAWRSGKFITYRELPGWDGPPWSLLLTPGWRELSGKSLAEIVASQWSTATRYLLDDLEQLSPDRWCVAGYDALVSEPQKEIERIASFLDIEWDRTLTTPLPLSRHTLTEPNRDKWKRNADDLKVALPLVSDVAERARNLFAHPPKPFAVRRSPSAVKNPADSSTAIGQRQTANDFSSVFTAPFASFLDQAKSSLLISTYQSGRLIIARVADGKLNTHLRAFASPMGIALSPQTLTLGTKNFIWHFRNHSGIATKIEEGRVDAAYVPSAAYGTGDIRVHELVYVGNELVIVNTRFSCLVTIDPVNSFRELWRPRFITEIVAEDRCHLNGVAVHEGEVRYVTALGESNEKAGWRANKADGGIVIDVKTHEIIARGLSMPHSPRIHKGKLWVLESGEGRLCTIDPANGTKTIVAEVPGFARGLAFAGPYAFIGLSQVRESVFEGIPIAKRTERMCGVWLVDTRDGKIAGFLRFEGIVQEIFDVQLLSGIRYPEVLEPLDDYVGAAFTLPLSEVAR